MTIIEDTVKLNYKPLRVGIGCELCPVVMSGAKFDFYCCRVARVQVSLSRGQVRCVCGQVADTQEADRSCKRCGRTKTIRQAEINVDDKYLQVIVCPIDYDKLVDNAVRLRAAAGQLES